MSLFLNVQQMNYENVSHEKKTKNKKLRRKKEEKKGKCDDDVIRGIISLDEWNVIRITDGWRGREGRNDILQ